MARKNKKQSSQKSAQPKKTGPGTRFTVDDPVNDIHDDELYDEETGLRKESGESEEFERPW
jgi:hypothetical protein